MHVMYRTLPRAVHISMGHLPAVKAQLLLLVRVEHGIPMLVVKFGKPREWVLSALLVQLEAQILDHRSSDHQGLLRSKPCLTWLLTR